MTKGSIKHANKRPSLRAHARSRIKPLMRFELPVSGAVYLPMEKFTFPNCLFGRLLAVNARRQAETRIGVMATFAVREPEMRMLGSLSVVALAVGLSGAAGAQPIDSPEQAARTVSPSST
jgi:hypothetical protein